MTTYFVTAHPGALDWARAQGIEAAAVAHLDPAVVKAGDIVIGTLPVHLVAAIGERGGRYLHLAMELPAEARRRELSAEDMVRYGARLEEYEARRVGK